MRCSRGSSTVSVSAEYACKQSHTMLQLPRSLVDGVGARRAGVGAGVARIARAAGVPLCRRVCNVVAVKVATPSLESVVKAQPACVVCVCVCVQVAELSMSTQRPQELVSAAASWMCCCPCCSCVACAAAAAAAGICMLTNVLPASQQQQEPHRVISNCRWAVAFSAISCTVVRTAHLVHQGEAKVEALRLATCCRQVQQPAWPAWPIRTTGARPLLAVLLPRRTWHAAVVDDDAIHGLQVWVVLGEGHLAKGEGGVAEERAVPASRRQRPAMWHAGPHDSAAVTSFRHASVSPSRPAAAHVYTLSVVASPWCSVFFISSSTWLPGRTAAVECVFAWSGVRAHACQQQAGTPECYCSHHTASTRFPSS